MRRIPYGETDFVTMRRENSYYVDKTAFITYFENAAKYLMFLRPRRFGKSLFLNMLAAYYDILEKDNYNQNFGGLDISKNTTPKQGQYMVLKFNFSAVDSRKENVESSFNIKVYDTIIAFVDKYKDYLPKNAMDFILESAGKSDIALTKLLIAATKSQYKIYIMIDEYDNFANTIFSTDEEVYKKLT
ncbi:MAG: AAA family ATPase, partial [Bacteroidales bacterium]|nr:AAA family ATPase [Bacteroidales bacterium]